MGYLGFDAYDCPGIQTGIKKKAKNEMLIQHCQSEHYVRGMARTWTDTPLVDTSKKLVKPIR